MKDPLAALLDLYADDASFQDYAQQDLDDDAVWFNFKEFARYRDVDGERLLCVFCGARSQVIEIRQNASERFEGVYARRGILFIRADELDGEYAPGAPLQLNGKLYTVQGSRLLQDVLWRIELEANDS